MQLGSEQIRRIRIRLAKMCEANDCDIVVAARQFCEWATPKLKEGSVFLTGVRTGPFADCPEEPFEFGGITMEHIRIAEEQ